VCALFLLVISPAQAATPKIQFDMVREGKKIGIHQVVVKEKDDVQKVTVKIVIDVKLGPLTLYKYRHESHETWKEGKLTALHSRTLDKGKNYSVDVEENGDGTLRMTNQEDEEYIVKNTIIPTSYWNKALTEQTELLDTQKGLVRIVNFLQGTEETYSGRIGGTVYRAIPYTMSGDLRMKLWYTPEGEWVGLQFQQKDSTIVYRRAPYAPFDVVF